MNLTKFERTVFLLSVFAIVSSIVIGLICWYLFTELVELGPIWATVMTFTVWVISAFMFGYQMSKSALAPVSALYKALDHMSANPVDATPPNPDEYTLSKELVAQIVHDVYGLTAGMHESQQEAAAEKAFAEAMLSLSSNPILAMDRNGIIKFANQSAVDLMPASVDNAVGMTLGDTLAPEFASGPTFADWLAKAEAEKIHDRYVWEHVRVDAGSSHYKYFDIAVDYNKNETHGIEVLLVMLDKTSSYHEDDTAVDFVSLAVHELRSPISLLRGYIEVFQDELTDKLDDEQQDFMAKMAASAGQLSTFVNNILNVAKIENDELKVHLEEDDIENVIQSSQADFELRAAVRNRNLTFSFDQNLPTVGIDRVGFYEVMSNLIDNAIKYTKDGGTISVVAIKREGGVTVSVTDDGVGIPSSSLENLFERFYRSHHSKDKVAGTGLGLFLSKTIIEAHGGTIWVKSTEGKGATFGIDLPSFADLSSENTVDGEDPLIRHAHGWIKNHGKVRK